MLLNELKKKISNEFNYLKKKNLKRKNGKTKYEIESYLENPELWHIDVCKFLQYGDGNIEYFKNMYIGLKNYTNDEKYLKIQSLLHLCSDNYERIICYRFLMDLEILSSDDLRKYNEIILKTKQIDMKYCLHLDVNGYVFRHKNCIYPEYYNDRRKTIKSLIDVYWDEEAIFRNVDNNRIAILTNFLGDSLAATTTYILDDSLALCNAGKEVEIFVAGHHFWNPKDAFLNMKTPLTDDFEKYAKEHERLTEGKIKIHYIKGNTIDSRLHNCVHAIQKFDPCAVIDYSSQKAFESAVVMNYYPVLYVSLTGYSTCDMFHKIMCSNVKMWTEQNEIYHSIDTKDLIPYDKPIRKVLPKNVFSRKKFGFLETDFLLVTVGNRIEFELEKQCVDAIIPVIEKYSHIKWIIVSPNEYKYIKDKYSKLVKNKKIVFWGFEKDISGLYTMCNAYVNPNRTGGGASIAYAMHMGLPILMNNYPSDALPYVGIENTTENYSGMAEKLEKFVNDDFYYQQWKEKTLQRANAYSTAHAISQYIDGIEIMKKELLDMQ
mgnify:FL=1